MRCEQARELMHLEADCPISPAEQQDLNDHIASCPACAACLREAECLVAAFREDRDCVDSRVHLSDAFEQRLHDALLAENAFRSQRRFELLARNAEEWLRNSRRLSARLMRGAMAAAVVVLAILAASAVFAPPGRQPKECRFDHIAALDIQRAPDGRVYAVLTQHASACRSYLAEADRR